MSLALDCAGQRVRVDARHGHHHMGSVLLHLEVDLRKHDRAGEASTVVGPDRHGLPSVVAFGGKPENPKLVAGHHVAAEPELDVQQQDYLC